jgi:hypothetical protein
MDIAQLERLSRAELPEPLPVGQRSMNHSLETRTNGGSTELGEPLSVYEVAKLIGCSAWTVRQKHLREGLPCFRSGPSGRLTFYRNQVVAWILEKQKQTKGGQIQ